MQREDQYALVSTGGAGALTLLNLVRPEISTLLGCAFVAVLVWLARPSCLPALVVLNLQSTDFMLKHYGTAEHLVQQFEANYVMLGGFPLTVNLVFAVMIAGRVGFECVTSWRTFSGYISPIMFGFWFICFGIAAVIALKGRAMGFYGWSDPIRAVCIIGSFFYGFILLKRWPPGDVVFFRWLLPLFTVLIVLAALGAMHSRFNWIIATLMPPALGYCLFRRASGLVWAFVGFIACASYCFLGPLGGYLSSGESEFGSTFTLRGLFSFSLALSILSLVPWAQAKQTAGRLMGLPALVVALGFTVFVTYNYEKYTIGREFMGDSVNPTIKERLQAKIFDDRALLWNNSWTHIVSQDPVFPIAGAPIFYHHPKQGPIYLTIGSHNVYLHQLRLLGWVGGIIVLVIFCYATWCASYAFRKSQMPEVMVFAISALITNIFGGVTGHYVIGPNVSFFVFALAGVAYGMSTLGWHQMPQRATGRVAGSGVVIR